MTVCELLSMSVSDDILVTIVDTQFFLRYLSSVVTDPLFPSYADLVVDSYRVAYASLSAFSGVTYEHLPDDLEHLLVIFFQ